MKICEFCKEAVLDEKIQFFIREINNPDNLLRVCRECFQIAGISNKVNRAAKKSKLKGFFYYRMMHKKNGSVWQFSK